MQSERSFRYTPVKWEDLTARTEKLKKKYFFFYSISLVIINPPPSMSSKPRHGVDWRGWDRLVGVGGEQERKINYCLNEQLVSL